MSRWLSAAALLGSSWACQDLTISGGSAWHDVGGVKYTCADHYNNENSCKSDGDKYAFEGLTGNMACCACGGGDGTGSCVHMKFPDGTEWHDSGGAKYTCAKFYNKMSRCGADGDKFANQGLTANMACCDCGGGFGSADEACYVNNDWVHDSYGDTCEDYMPGGKSYEYECDPRAKKECCTCSGLKPKTEDDAEMQCVDKTADGVAWHDNGGAMYDCGYYAEKDTRCSKDGNRFAWKGLTANEACCDCGGGEMMKATVQCTDKTMDDGSPFQDSGGATYNCEYYGKPGKNRCAKDGNKYMNSEGLTAKAACCVCGGGDVVGDDGIDYNPKPNGNDNIIEEWMGGTLFKNKKHLQGGHIAYWNTDMVAKTVTLGLLSPYNPNSWVAVGYSKDGNMAGSDVVAAWFDDEGKPVIKDLYLESQSPAGIKSLDRQDVKDVLLTTWNGHTALTFTRDWVVEGATEVKVEVDFVPIIYATGKVDRKCGVSELCNHSPQDRFSSELALSVPFGMTSYDINLGSDGEPCHGPAELECYAGYYCVHINALDGDIFKFTNVTYGDCRDKEFLGDESNIEEDWTGIQNVFSNNGGFENEIRLSGGFVVLWTVNKVSVGKVLGPDDSLSVAVISTLPDRQGWIGFGWTPNGLMKGSDVVIGWDDGAGNTDVGDFYLMGQVPNVNKKSGKQELLSSRVIKKNGQTALVFERPFVPADSVQVIDGLSRILFAAGPMPDVDDKEFIPYHRFRDTRDVEFLKAFDPNPLAQKGQQCAGQNNIQCSIEPEFLECLVITEDIISMALPEDQDVQLMDIPEEAWEGFTMASGFRDGGQINPFKFLTSLVGKGVCVDPKEKDDFDKMMEMDTDILDDIMIINKKEFDHFQELTWGFNIYWSIIDDGKRIKVALVTRLGDGWLGLAFGNGGKMIGATAVIGWLDADDQPDIAEYYLQNKLPWEVLDVEAAGMTDHAFGATNLEVKKSGIENAIVFERDLVPDNGVGIIEPYGPTTILVAYGATPHENDDYFGYHRFREAKDIFFHRGWTPSKYYGCDNLVNCMCAIHTPNCCSQESWGAFCDNDVEKQPQCTCHLYKMPILVG